VKRRDQPETRALALSRVGAPLSPAKRVIFGIVTALLSITFCFAVAEVLARLRGFRPYVPVQYNMRVEPGGKFNTPHPTLGYTHIPGRFEITFDNGDHWTLTHRADTLRITRPPESDPEFANLPGIWIFGCSFVHGWGLDDEDTLPWKVQEKLPEFDVVNFGVGGYSNLQSLMQFREALDERAAPRLVILAYASFHDERNTRLRRWRKYTYEYAKFGSTAQPYARLTGDGSELAIHFDDGRYFDIELLQRSALLRLLDESYSQMEDRRHRSAVVTTMIFEEFARECRRRGIGFAIVGVHREANTTLRLRAARDRGIRTADVGANMETPGFKIPYDGHPSGLANEVSATRLARFIRRILHDGSRT
jgi:hypothetical protein